MRRRRPAEALFKPEFDVALKSALRPNGIISKQGECAWLHLKLIESVLRGLAPHFASVDYAYSGVPTYPSGQMGYVLATTNPTRE